MAKKSLIESLRVTSPCTEDWDKMTGNNRVRFCSHCDLSVNNVSALTRREALKLVRKSNSRICVRYIKNPQTNAPVFADKLYQISRRTGIAAGVLGASLAVSTVAYAQGGVRISNDLQTTTETAQINTIDNEEDKESGGTASVSGSVTDSNGALIPGAIVKIYSKDFSRTIATNDEGFYRFLQVPVGDLQVEVTAINFEIKTFDIFASNGKEIVLNTSLEPDTQVVTVGGIGFIEYEQPLLKAVSDEDFEEVQNLLANGTDANVKDGNYEDTTALFVAIERGNIKLVELLLNFGADVNIRDEENRTPIMNLGEKATPELVNLLIRYDANFKAVDKSGSNVLHHLIGYESAEVMDALIKTGVDINLQNEDGRTPLMTAAYYEDLASVKALLDAGADFNLKDKENKTALSIALEEEAEEIIKFLISRGATH